MSRRELLNFIRRHSLAVVATTSETGVAQGAVVEFGSSDDLEVIFDTFRSSRKYENLKREQRCSFVIGWDGDRTLQYEGIATELDGADLQRYQSIYFDQVPEAAKFAEDPGVAFFRVVPTWIRLTDLSVTPWLIEEHTVHSE